MFQNDDIIFALSSGNPPAGVAVIRISGAALGEMFQKLAGIAKPKPRHMYFTNLKGIDECLVAWFKAPASFTGEDVIEIHSHGSIAVIDKIYELLRGLGARIAERGEFAARAFMNGKMDLQSIDGLGDLINAKTERQRIQAFASYTGSGSRLYQTWRNELVLISANLAAATEFPAQELPGGLVPDAMEKIKTLLEQIDSHLGTYAAGRIIKSGFRIVLGGLVNAGKSSLFNALIGSDRAIVSSVPGTTRDWISAQMDIEGYLVELVDTAGLRESDNEIESIGIEKSKELIESADLVIEVKREKLKGKSDDGFIVYTHGDLTGDPDAVSVVTGQNMDKLIARIKSEIEKRIGVAEPFCVSNEKTAELLRQATGYLSAALAQTIPELTAENVRLAANALGKVLGVVDFDEIQSAIFGRLCMGK
ncbi:MAG: tRNA uridine-5-carboxymethylaminomethyl(34) synthesis GTPase MnmE [Alphaproteobacteria bacterium]|nr:tRNA uridine-5-carboxymethylaminomethyl(34) synthesis GTPase MnmE [Alphaproteobacteria bacterium]